MEGEHAVELFFHCHEECAVERVEGGFRLARGERSIVLLLPEGGETHVLEASEHPIGGWISRRFDRKVRAPTLLWSAIVRGRQVLRTRIDCA
jgi:hypothetical protein